MCPWWRKTLWELGFDPLTIYERLRQVDIEREYWREIVDTGVPLK